MDEEDNTKEIAQNIFSRPPGKKNSIQLQLEDKTADIANQRGVDMFITKILTIITLHGVEILFGHRQLLQLTEENYNLLQRYVNSYGYYMIKKIDNNKIIINFEKVYG